MSNHIFVLDTNRKPLTPCKPGVVRPLLKAGKASVFRRYLFRGKPCSIKLKQNRT
ncbi:RRXRR domain-containing protein [Arthrospira platensis SPKY1]|nr:RRXRR domain-containing protein [Arthrospira platensis SPKY1]